MKLRHNTKRIFAVWLAVWLSGIVVLFCCGNMPVKAADIESCPLAKKGSCRKTVEAESKVSFEQTPLTTFDCCAFPAKIFDKFRKLEKSPESATPTPAANIAAPRFFNVEKTFQSPKFYHSHFPNRRETHLRNCIFRN